MSKFIPYPFFHDDAPVDISFVFADEKPAGKHGFLKIEGRDFVFEDGTKAKFWGTNFNGWGCFPEHDYAEKLARRLAKFGLNLVRFHQLDSEWHTPNIFAFTKGKRVTGAELDPESMDRLDYLIYCLKKEGIYCYLDMFTYRKFRSDEGVVDAHQLKDAAKPSCIFDDHLIELQKDLCRRLWTHVNPYTGLAYCDDPIFVMAEIVNEADLFGSHGSHAIPKYYQGVFYAKLDKWLADHNYTDLKASDFDCDDKTNDILTAFRIDLQSEYYRQMYACMRECGVKIPINGTNWLSTPACMLTQLETDYFDLHPYYYDWRWGEFEKHCKSRSITQTDTSFLWIGSAGATADRPTYVSEWDMPWPNDYRAESPIYCAAMGMFQGWSGFAIHTYSYSARLERMDMLGKEIASEKIGNVPYRQGIFSTWNDPAKFGLFYHAALITRRGDVKTSENMLQVKPVSKTEWDVTSIAANFERTCVVSDLSFTEAGKDMGTPTPKQILSDTKELYIDRERNYGFVDTDMTKCAYGFLAKNGKIGLNGVDITCDNDFAVIAMSSLTDKGLSGSDNILLTTVGRAENTGFKYNGDLMTDYGEPPILVESIKADIAIETNVEGLVVWAISPEGFYVGTVPSRYENGKFCFKLGEVSQSMYYLIVKE